MESHFNLYLFGLSRLQWPWRSSIFLEVGPIYDQSGCLCACSWGGAGAVRRGSIDNFYLSTGLSWSPAWPWGDGPGCGASLAIGKSCGQSSNSMQ